MTGSHDLLESYIGNRVIILLLPSRVLSLRNVHFLRDVALPKLTSTLFSLLLLLLGLLDLSWYFVVASYWCHQAPQILISQEPDECLDELRDIVLEGDLAELVKVQTSAASMLLSVQVDVEIERDPILASKPFPCLLETLIAAREGIRNDWLDLICHLLERLVASLWGLWCGRCFLDGPDIIHVCINLLVVEIILIFGLVSLITRWFDILVIIFRRCAAGQRVYLSS